MPVLRDGHIASWKPDFYPAKLAQAKFLQHYSTQLNAVEVNFHFPPVAERDDGAEMDQRDAVKFSFQREGASGHHAH